MLIADKTKKGEIAKFILKNLQEENKKEISLDEIVQALPPGTMDLIRKRK